MSTETSIQADAEHRDKTDSESSRQHFPALTITAEGVAERTQEVGTHQLPCLETMPVQLSVSVMLSSQSQWKDLVDPTFRTHYPTVERGAFVDRLLEELDSGAMYERQSSGTAKAPQWELTIEGTATEWQRLMMDFIVREERDDEDRAYQAVSYLEQLLASGLANAGAALAALALIDEHDVDRSTDSFREYIDEIGGDEG